jgi:hypothetical protein
MTLTRPKVDVQIKDSAPPSVALTGTGTAFIVGLAHKGPAETAADGLASPLAISDAVHSLDELIAKYGPRQSYNGLEYDAAEAAFTDGVAALFFSRKVGPAAVKASITVPSASPQYTVKAKGPGLYANGWTFTMTSGVGTLKDSAGALLEVTPTLATVADLQAWATQTSQQIDIAPSGSGALVDSAARALAGGVDDRTNITDVQIQHAMDRFGRNLGPGNMALPGDTHPSILAYWAQHCATYNRWAYVDMTDSPVAATVTANAATIRALGRDLARRMIPIDGWGYMTAADRQRHPAHRPGLRRDARRRRHHRRRGQPERRDRRPELLQPRVHRPEVQPHRRRPRRVRRRRRHPAAVRRGRRPPDGRHHRGRSRRRPEWLGAAGGRMLMRIVADILTIGKAHQFQQTSPKLAIADFHKDVGGMLQGWLAKGALFTDDSGAESSAFNVVTGPPVNTVDTMAAKQLNVAVSLKLTPNSRQVTAFITNTPVNGTL